MSDSRMCDPVGIALDLIETLECDFAALQIQHDRVCEDVAIACGMYAEEVKRADKWRRWAFAFCTMAILAAIVSPLITAAVLRAQ